MTPAETCEIISGDARMRRDSGIGSSSALQTRIPRRTRERVLNEITMRRGILHGDKKKFY